MVEDLVVEHICRVLQLPIPQSLYFAEVAQIDPVLPEVDLHFVEAPAQSAKEQHNDDKEQLKSEESVEMGDFLVALYELVDGRVLLLPDFLVLVVHVLLGLPHLAAVHCHRVLPSLAQVRQEVQAVPGHLTLVQSQRPVYLSEYAVYLLPVDHGEDLEQ